MSTAQAPTPHAALDALLSRMKDASKSFARLSIDDRIRLCEQMKQGFVNVAEDSVRAACQAKGIDPQSALAGEEWLAGPAITVRNLRLLCDSLRDIKRHGVPRIDPAWLSELPDGRLAVKLYPTSLLDSMLLMRHVGQAHMQKGVTRQNLREHQASFYRKPHGGKLCVILGAGNVNSIPPTDALYKLFVEGTVVVVKMNPVNAYLGPFMEKAFAAAVEKGYFAVVYGGAEEGGYLINHPATDEIHITGSDKTHDQLVWGPPGPDREARKVRNEPLLKKHITSELGNISPVVVVPGPYDPSQLGYQAKSIAGMVTNNASFNCNSAKLLVTQEGWSQRTSLLDQVTQGMSRAPTRKAYYPGAEDRWKQFTAGRDGLRLVGTPGAGELAYALIPNVPASKVDDQVFHQEPWCAVLSETQLPGKDVPSFLAEAVRFLNDRLWGTLCATLVVHPQTLADPVNREAFEAAIAALRYGTVAVNTWPAAVFGLITTPWGGHPSATLQNIQSGIGWVHNTFMLEGIEKCVLRAPVKGFPVAPWMPGHRSVDEVAKRLVGFNAEPSWLKVPGLAAAALKA